MKKLLGLSAFPITPSDAGGRVECMALRGLLRPLIAAEVDSVGLLGSTGSYPYLSRTERRRALETAIEEARGDVPILVGVGALRTDEAVLLAQDARAIGAAAGLLAPVSYTPLTDDEVFEHFSSVARESGLPLCIYDNPGTTHFTFSPALVNRLAKVPGIVGIKCPAPDARSVSSHLSEMRAAVPNGFSVGYSVDWNAVEALLAGGDVWYSVLAGVFPDVCKKIVVAAQRGDDVEARRVAARLQPIWEVFREFSSLRVVYALAEMRGLCRAAPPRPVLPLSGSARQKVELAYQTLPIADQGIIDV